MNFANSWRSEKTRKHKARATRKPKIRWEVLGFPGALGLSPTTSIEDIRRQVSHMASSGLEQGPHTAEGRARPPSSAPVSNKRCRG